MEKGRDIFLLGVCWFGEYDVDGLGGWGVLYLVFLGFLGWVGGGYGKMGVGRGGDLGGCYMEGEGLRGNCRFVFEFGGGRVGGFWI